MSLCASQKFEYDFTNTQNLKDLKLHKLMIDVGNKHVYLQYMYNSIILYKI